ncbi:MAG: cytochrome c oxidase assembly protein [Actinomycetes bacterium]
MTPRVVGHLAEGPSGFAVYLVALGIGVAWAIRRMTASSAAGSPDRRDDRLRDAALVGGVIAVTLALVEPVEHYADRLFWVHMAQHVVLLTVAAPLLAVGAPWRFAPPGLVARWRGWFSGRGSVAMISASAAAAWIVFNATFLVFHVPFLYDAAIRNVGVHLIEHALFLATAVWFWAAVFDARSFRAEPIELWRSGYVLAAAGVGWFLAIVLTFAREPLYTEYARLGVRPGGISALADQQLAAGVMLVPGSITFLVIAGFAIARWVGTGAPDPTTSFPLNHEEMSA